MPSLSAPTVPFPAAAPAVAAGARAAARTAGKTEKVTLCACNFLSKGWEITLPALLVYFRTDYGMPLFMVGLLTTVFIVSQITVSLFAGRIAHAIRGRSVIFLSILASGLAWLLLFLSGGNYALACAFLFGGISSGLFEPIGNSLVAKMSDAKSRGKSIGEFAAFGDMGRIAVLAAATAIEPLLGLKLTCAVLLGTTIAALVAAGIFIRPSGPAVETEGKPERVHLRELMGNQRFCWATLAGIGDSFSSSSLYIFLPFLVAAKGVPSTQLGWFTDIFFFGYLSGRLVLGRFSERHGAPNLVMVSKFVMAALLVVLTLASGRYLALGALVFALGIFTRGSSPLIRAMVADSVDDKTNFHDAFGAYSFASRGSSAFSRPCFGYIAGLSIGSVSGISAVFYAASAVSLLTLYPAARFKRSYRSN